MIPPIHVVPTFLLHAGEESGRLVEQYAVDRKIFVESAEVDVPDDLKAYIDAPIPCPAQSLLGFLERHPVYRTSPNWEKDLGVQLLFLADRSWLTRHIGTAGGGAAGGQAPATFDDSIKKHQRLLTLIVFEDQESYPEQEFLELFDWVSKCRWIDSCWWIDNQTENLQLLKETRTDQALLWIDCLVQGQLAERFLSSEYVHRRGTESGALDRIVGSFRVLRIPFGKLEIVRSLLQVHLDRELFSEEARRARTEDEDVDIEAALFKYASEKDHDMRYKLGLDLFFEVAVCSRGKEKTQGLAELIAASERHSNTLENYMDRRWLLEDLQRFQRAVEFTNLITKYKRNAESGRKKPEKAGFFGRARRSSETEEGPDQHAGGSGDGVIDPDAKNAIDEIERIGKFIELASQFRMQLKQRMAPWNYSQTFSLKDYVVARKNEKRWLACFENADKFDMKALFLDAAAKYLNDNDFVTWQDFYSRWIEEVAENAVRDDIVSQATIDDITADITSEIVQYLKSPALLWRYDETNYSAKALIAESDLTEEKKVQWENRMKKVKREQIEILKNHEEECLKIIHFGQRT